MAFLSLIVPSLLPPMAVNPTTPCPTRTPTFLTLPLELHLLIGAQLPFPAYLSLRLTHPYLYHALATSTQPPPLRALDQCARVAVLTYLAPYLSPSTFTTERSAIDRVSPKQQPPQQRQQRCALCGNVYPLHLFRSAASPACSIQDHGPIHTATGRHSRLHHHPSSSSRGWTLLEEAEEETVSVEAAGTQGACVGSDEAAKERNHRLNGDTLAGKRRGEPGWDVVELPQRVCCWHVGRLTRVVKVKQQQQHQMQQQQQQQDAEMEHVGHDDARMMVQKGNNNRNDKNYCRAAEEPCTSPSSLDARTGTLQAWVSRVEQMCTHCGAIQDWRPCRCRCQGCGLRAARTYTRYAEPGWRCSGYVFWRDDGGRLWVRETVVVGGSDEFRTTSFVDVPVIFE